MLTTRNYQRWEIHQGHRHLKRLPSQQHSRSTFLQPFQPKLVQPFPVHQTRCKAKKDKFLPRITYPVQAGAGILIDNLEAVRAVETLLQRFLKLAAAIFSADKVARPPTVTSHPQGPGCRKQKRSFFFCPYSTWLPSAFVPLVNELSRLPLRPRPYLPLPLQLPLVAMAAMSLLQRASVTAVTALSGLRSRLGCGGFLTRSGVPKAIGECWL